MRCDPRPSETPTCGTEIPTGSIAPVSAEGGNPITLSKTVPKLAPQESATVELPLDRTPPTGSAVTIRTTVAKVPGEEKVDNNRSEYPALFERG